VIIMIKILFNRILSLIPVLFIVSIVSFSVIHITPGDVAQNALKSPSGGADQKAVEEFRMKMGLNKPIYIQYLHWILYVLKGDLGYSYMTGESVLNKICDRFLITLRLGAVSMLISLSIAIPIGIIGAIKKNTLLDNVIRTFALIGVSMPNFWLAYILIIIFALTLHWFPVAGFGDNGDLMHAILPSIALGAVYSAVMMRLMRSSMIETLEQEFVRAARAKGLPEWMIIIRHALKNALLPVITMIGINFAYILSGSIIIENIFAWPGIGQLIVSSIKLKDIPMIQGCILFLAVLFVLVNFAVDICYIYLNPRIRNDEDN
jgi:peptide/nickel transport system permease protein